MIEHGAHKLILTWQHASHRKRNIIYYGVYTLAFLLAFLLAYSPFLLDGKSFIWQVDGRLQHFPFFVYIGRALRRILLKMTGGELSIPLFDISMGLGDDILGFLSTNGATDPLLLLSAFVPAKLSEYLYAFLAIFRVYLAGLSFSFLCFYFQKRTLHTLTGSLVYCFCGYAIVCSMRHPYFVNPMILLPLLIVGIDKILGKKRPYLFIFALAYAALCGFYHLYMLTIMIVVYALVRFFDLYSENRPREFASALCRGVAGYLLGIGLSATVLLPAVMEFFNAGRSGFSNYSGAYPWTYYTTHLGRLIAPPGSWDDMAFAAIVLFAFVLLFFAKRKRTLKILTVTVFVVLLTSIGGLIMNGFQYSSNRWTFALALVAAYAVVEMLPELVHLSRKQKLICIATLAVYATACFATKLMRTLKYMPVGVIFLSVTLLVFVLTLQDPGTEIDGKQRGKGGGCLTHYGLRGVICVLLVVANIGVNGIYLFATDQGNYSGQFQQRGYETARLENAVERELEPHLLDNPDGRSDGTEFTQNTGMVWQIPGMLTYSSTADGNMTEFWNATETSGVNQNFCIWSTDQRTIVNTLLSEKYQVEPEKKSAYVPYGYTPIGKTKNDRVIYENTYALPWGYTYDRTMSYDELEGLNGLEKQEAMLQAIALEQGTDFSEPQEDISFDAKRLPYTITYKNCEWKDGQLTVSNPNATMTLQFDMPASVEGYVRLRGFDLNDSGLSSYAVQVRCGEVSRYTTARSKLYVWYYGRESYLFNLGYSEVARNSLTITFPSKGVVRLQDIELYALPMENYPSRVEALRAEPLNNIQWGTNSLSGTIDLSKDKILCVSVPYSEGWSATVDGEKAEILRGNYMFMALSLAAGHHDIQFRYCSPGLKLGAGISLVSTCFVAGMLLRDWHRKKVEHD